MTSGYPPLPTYPTALDTDYTLFLVYNTTESQLSANNSPHAEEILIEPSAVWADNGFATISGELFYYDSVSRDGDDLVYKLKSCIRNLGGSQTRYNLEGTWVRGFVVAEHHNQLVDCVLAVEDFIGENFSKDVTTLDYRIRHLAAQTPLFDDFNCPDVDFAFNIVSEDPVQGTLVSYAVTIQGNGKFILQFGDGSSTAVQASGTHLYYPNANIDPVVVLTNDKCQILQTPISRGNISEPTAQATTSPWQIQVPTTPTIPDLSIPTLVIPSFDLFIPPTIPPCGISLALFSGEGGVSIPSLITISPPIPSLIEFGPLNIPSLITITPISLPSIIMFDNIPSFSPIQFDDFPEVPDIEFGDLPAFPEIDFGPLPSFPTISFGPAPTIPSVSFGPSPLPTTITFGPSPLPTTITFGPSPLPAVITFGPAPSIPSNITFGPGPNIPSQITFGPAPSFPTTINFGPNPLPSVISFGPAPTISMTWGTPPTVTCSCVVICPSPSPFASKPPRPEALGSQRMAPDPGFTNMGVEYELVGFPSVINIVAPDIPPIRVIHDIPSIIQVQMPEFPEIKIQNINLPSEIRIIAPDRNSMINVISFALPESIRLDVPENMTISLKIPDDIPTLKIDIPNEIKVVGFPDSIKLEAPENIRLFVPEDLYVPLRFEGPPISVHINLGIDKMTDGEDGIQCVKIIPCGRK